jgi:hypothetical protein
MTGLHGLMLHDIYVRMLIRTGCAGHCSCQRVSGIALTETAHQSTKNSSTSTIVMTSYSAAVPQIGHSCMMHTCEETGIAAVSSEGEPARKTFIPAWIIEAMARRMRLSLSCESSNEACVCSASVCACRAFSSASVRAASASRRASSHARTRSS